MHRVGVCSWSLRPSGPGSLADHLRACGLDAVQLALEPLRDKSWPEAETRDRLAEAGVTILSGMMSTVGEDYSTLETIRETGGLRPDRHWPANLRAARENAALANRLGLRLVTLHAGFLPHAPGDPERAVLVDRLREVAAVFADHGVALALETGQESAHTLTGILDELGPETGVNFDPANMILYGTGDPLAALRSLAPRVRQVHVKDAVPSSAPGRWGAETPAGRGAVDWPGFFAIISQRLPAVDLVIEREAGDSRVEDVRAARSLIRDHLGS